MQNLLKRYKEIVFLIGVAFVAVLAAHDLFSEQQQNSGLINSGTTLTPSNFSGRVSCEVPIPSVQSRTIPEEADIFPKKNSINNPEGESVSRSN